MANVFNHVLNSFPQKTFLIQSENDALYAPVIHGTHIPSGIEGDTLEYRTGAWTATPKLDITDGGNF